MRIYTQNRDNVTPGVPWPGVNRREGLKNERSLCVLYLPKRARIKPLSSRAVEG
jgi:hypothetical protein